MTKLRNDRRIKRGPAGAAAALRPLAALALVSAGVPALADTAPPTHLAPAAAKTWTLAEVLAQTYENNPDLKVARDQLRAADAGVPLARADGLPSLQAAAGFNRYLSAGSTVIVGPTDQLALTGSLSVPIYQGGKVANAVSAAKQRVVASRHDLEAVEGNVFSQAVAAYVGVIHDEAVVDINQQNVDALAQTLKGNTIRYEKGELTRTDVAQSRDRLEQAKALLLQAQVTLDASREHFARITGVAPDTLGAPQPLVGLPLSADDAVQTALQTNPDLQSASAKSRAAHFDTRGAASARLPRVSGVGSYEYDDYMGTYGQAAGLASQYSQHQRVAVVGAQVTVPLYQGGRPSALVRQAEAQESASLDTVDSVTRAVQETTRAAFYAWRTSESIIKASETAVASAEAAVVGVREGNKLGAYTIIDVLNAEQEVLVTKVQLVTARRDAYIAAFNLLTAMGQARASNLGIEPADIYDPLAHYRQVADTVWDWSSDPAPLSLVKPAKPVPVQDGELRAKPSGPTP